MSFSSYIVGCILWRLGLRVCPWGGRLGLRGFGVFVGLSGCPWGVGGSYFVSQPSALCLRYPVKFTF